MNSFSRDFQVKSLEQKVKHAKKHLGDICNLMGSYTRKTAKLRDKADQLVAQLFDYSSSEGPELQMSLRNFAEDLAIVQDYRQAQVERLETRVVAPMKGYGDIIKNKEVELKRFRSDLNREVKELQKLDRIRLRNPADRQSISKAEVSAQKASNNAQRGGRHLEESFTDFQRQKLEHVKRIFTDFITVEMLFHAKALEIYTGTYHNLEAINKDPEAFSGSIKISDSLPGHLDMTTSSHSFALLSTYTGDALSSTKGPRLRSMLESPTGHSSRLQHGHLHEGAKRGHKILQRQRCLEEEEDEEEEV
ncbi:protein FAM92B-like, partial [Cynoglossus semilaevis]|uniref:protein FAM92B-like n=1 Tax=Cynoglossus semilaevis TaxID=244447 RepID=UPI0007DC8E8C